MKNSFTGEYYDKAWPRIALSISPREEERIRQTLSLIPQGISSILDAGCGDGRIINRLISQYSKVVALESSKDALQYVKAAKILGSIDSLPFSDRSFDLILCCEVLEHLPFRVYPKALKELERVAAKYIIVTVPNTQDLKRGMVTCPHCGCVFSCVRHLRSFTPESLKGLFVKFSPQILRACLPLRFYPTLLLNLAESVRVLPKDPFPTAALCPQCGYSPSLNETSSKANIANKDSLFIRFLGPLTSRLIPGGKRGVWLLALYQRIERAQR